MIVCFEKHLSSEWHRVVKTIVELGQRLLGELIKYIALLL